MGVEAKQEGHPKGCPPVVMPNYNQRHIFLVYEPEFDSYDVWASWGDEVHQQRLFVAKLRVDYQVVAAFFDLWTLLEARRTP
jgi:hypothetical protein